MLSLRGIRDEDLLHQLFQLVKQSRGFEAEVVAHIGEVEFRRLHAREACSSMFEYCRRILCFRENEAYLRITVARAAREHPVLLEMLRDGRLHLSGIAPLAPDLTLENAQAVLKRACGMSHREIRELVAELAPRPATWFASPPASSCARSSSAYRDKYGRRCAKRHDLEFHHKHPFARGGDHSPANLTLMCRAHNTLLAEQDYGEDVMARFRAAMSRTSVPVDAYGARIVVKPRCLSSA